MTRSRYCTSALTGILMLLLPSLPGGSLAAHHSLAAQYNFDTELELVGVLKRMDWIRPHSVAHLEVTTPAGVKETWMFEFGGLDRKLLGELRGDKQLAIGQTVTFYGFRSKKGLTQAFLKKLKLADGRVIVTWFGDPNA